MTNKIKEGMVQEAVIETRYMETQSVWKSE